MMNVIDRIALTLAVIGALNSIAAKYASSPSESVASIAAVSTPLVRSR